MNKKEQYFKAAGVTTEEEFYSKYPNPSAFYKDFPQFEDGGLMPIQENIAVPNIDIFNQNQSPVYNIGDELELTTEEIKNLRDLGYNLEILS